MTLPVPAPSTQPPHPRVLLWGSYDTSKPRIRLLREGMKRAGLELTEIHSRVWEDVVDKSQILGTTAKLRRLWKLLRAYPALLWGLVRARRPDVLLVAYPGLLDVMIARIAANWWGVPLMFDVFISIYDTVVLDRRLLRPDTFFAKALRRIEARCLRWADHPFMDTAAHARYVESLFDLPPGHVGHVWVGAEIECFPSLPPRIRNNAEPLRVLFYGQFIPLHGIATIIEAARLLRDDPVQWILIGEGQESAHIDAMLLDDPLPTVQRIAWVHYEDLIAQMTHADVCLGIFGTSDKASNVIPNKMFQIIAAGRPFITRESNAIRELVREPGADAVLVPAGDASALAAAVRARLLRPSDEHAGCSACPAVGPDAVGQQFRLLVESALRSQVE